MWAIKLGRRRFILWDRCGEEDGGEGQTGEGCKGRGWEKVATEGGQG